MVSDAGGAIEYWVEYGPTDDYGSQTPHATVTAGRLEARSVFRQITGLERSTSYHYRFCAQDASQRGGPGCGSDASFTTQRVHCGDTVTEDVRLVASMLCGGSFTRPGLVIGAPDVEIDLNGFRFEGPGAGQGSPTPTAIDNTGGFASLTVRNGSISSWGVGVELDAAADNRLIDLDASGNTSGVRVEGGSGHVIRRSVMHGTRYGLGLGVVDSDELVVADSKGSLWLVRGNRARVVRNELTFGPPFSVCMTIFGSDHRIAYNKVSGCDNGGIVLQAGANDRFVGNESFNSTPDGISIGAFTMNTLLRGNYAHDNLDDGIDVRGTGTRLRDNRADDNGDFGIDAVAGVTDLGGNTASGNGNTLQCRNVFCAAEE